MKTVFLYREAWHSDRFERDWLTSLRKEFDASFIPVGQRIPSSASEVPGLLESDACVWMLKFRSLNQLPEFDWGGYQGQRVLYDSDAMNNFWTWGSTELLGAWTSCFRRLKFDYMVVNDASTAERFHADGIPAETVWKGFEGSRFFPLGFNRIGLGTFGMAYPARKATRIAMKRRRLDCKVFSCAYSELNRWLNCFEAVLVTNSSGKSRLGSTALNWIKPGLGLRMVDGAPDVLAKSFQVAASGAVLLTDRSPEFEQMGFVHGETALIYEEIGEVADLWREWKGHPESLRKIGTAGSALMHERHTFGHRARRLRKVLEAVLQ